MMDWLHAAAEVGGAVLAICIVIALVIALDWLMEDRRTRR